MIDTVDFYRGAAVLLLLRTPGCVEVRAAEEGFVVNRSAYFELKHCTSGKSRWSFQVSSRDVERMTQHSKQACSVFLGLVCGGDGVCTLALPDILAVAGSQGGRITVARPYGRSYAVSGSAGSLRRKVPRSDWPKLLLEEKNGGCSDE
jgi:hypothetical protein